jgi:hypothetical protein
MTFVDPTPPAAPQPEIPANPTPTPEITPDPSPEEAPATPSTDPGDNDSRPWDRSVKDEA